MSALSPTGERNRRRASACNKCEQNWSESNVIGKDLPPSAQDAAFPTLRYDYCAACGNLRVSRNQKVKK